MNAYQLSIPLTFAANCLGWMGLLTGSRARNAEVHRVGFRKWSLKGGCGLIMESKINNLKIKNTGPQQGWSVYATDHAQPHYKVG